MTGNELIAKWRGWVYVGGPIPWLSTKSERFHGVPPWDKGCGWWHGKYGLLAEIKNRNIIEEFIDELDVDIFGTDESFYGDIFAGMTATPAQLTSALVAVIKNEANALDKP